MARPAIRTATRLGVLLSTPTDVGDDVYDLGIGAHGAYLLPFNSRVRREYADYKFARLTLLHQ